MSCTITCRKANGRQAHCSACHQTFTAVSSFDHHRVGPVDERSCADPKARGMHLNAHGVWARQGEPRFWTARAQPSVDAQSDEHGSAVGVPTIEDSEPAQTVSGGWA